jgi:hypothetical protein
MKILTSFLILLIFITGCSEDPKVKNFKFQIAPANPPIIFANRTLRFVTGEEVTEIEIAGPWMLTGFNVINDNDRTITLVSLDFKVTGPDGKSRTASQFREIVGDTQNFFGVFKAEGDINCDGFVTPEDTNALPPSQCDLDNNNPSFLGAQIYVHDMLQGIKGNELDKFRGGNFTFEVRLEGWLGPPDAPEEGFFKIITFSVNSNN